MPGVIPTFYPIDFISATNRVVAISKLNQGEAERPTATGTSVPVLWAVLGQSG